MSHLHDTNLLENNADAQQTSSISRLTPSRLIRGEFIGRGQVGRVYIAIDTISGTLRAVKQIELRSWAGVEPQIDVLKRLSHPNLAAYHDFEPAVEHFCMLMEYVPGGSIGSFLQLYGAFSEDVTKSFTKQILDGLEYLHSEGIVHKNLKADNILVHRQGICKISDYGIMQDPDDPPIRVSDRTYWTAAPENLLPGSLTAYTAKSDIWSFGWVVLNMWSGIQPWNGEAVLAVILNDRLPPPVPTSVNLSDEAEDFRLKCLSFEPEDRLSAGELKNHAYLQNSPPSAPFPAHHAFPRPTVEEIYGRLDEFFPEHDLDQLTIDGPSGTQTLRDHARQRAAV